MPKYNGTAIGGGRERSIYVKTFQSADGASVCASTDVPMNQDGTKSNFISTIGLTEEQALELLKEKHPEYKIQVGEQISQAPHINQSS